MAEEIEDNPSEEIVENTADEKVVENTEDNSSTDETNEAEEKEDLKDPSDILDMSDEEFEQNISEPAAQNDSSNIEEEKDQKKEEEEKEEVIDPTSTSDTVTNSNTSTDSTNKITDIEQDPLSVEDSVAVTSYKEIMKPFKANGREVKVRTPEEAIRLMQMGAGHMRYQQQVKPMLAQAQTLKNNKITPERLNYLIELNNGNPDAIKKLVRDANIDPYDIETTDETKKADKEYQPQDYSASENQVVLEETVASATATEQGNQLLGEIRNSWDDTSRQMLLEDPGILSVLVDQKHSGIYDQITAEMDRKQTLGELTNASFLETYHQIGTELEAKGAFKPASPETSTETNTKSKESKVIATKVAKPKGPDNNAAVKAAASVKSTPSAKPTNDNILDMSDEEFAKLESKFG